jgi:hypothetical protein
MNQTQTMLPEVIQNIKKLKPTPTTYAELQQAYDHFNNELFAGALPPCLITQISPTAWRHILLNGHYTFQSDGKMIDLDALVAGLELG